MMRKNLVMPAPQSAPEWATELNVAFESGASGQFVLYGNVHDRLAAPTRPSPSHPR